MRSMHMKIWVCLGPGEESPLEITDTGHSAYYAMNGTSDLGYPGTLGGWTA